MRRLEPKVWALFVGLPAGEAERFRGYMLTRPRSPGGQPRLRHEVIGLYDEFCDRRKYPLGILWQCSPYSCCGHLCQFCYGRSYLHRFLSPLKLVFTRNVVQAFNASVMPAFLERHGGYRRMTRELQDSLMADMRRLCGEAGVGFEHCFHNILKRESERGKV